MVIGIVIGFVVVAASLLYLLDFICKVKNKSDLQAASIQKLQEVAVDLENNIYYLSKIDLMEKYKSLNSYHYYHRDRGTVIFRDENATAQECISISQIQNKLEYTMQLKERLCSNSCSKKKV